RPPYIPPMMSRTTPKSISAARDRVTMPAGRSSASPDPTPSPSISATAQHSVDYFGDAVVGTLSLCADVGHHLGCHRTRRLPDYARQVDSRNHLVGQRDQVDPVHDRVDVDIGHY